MTLHQESAPLLWLSLDDRRDRSQMEPNLGYRVDEGEGSVIKCSEMHLSCGLYEWEHCCKDIFPCFAIINVAASKVNNAIYHLKCKRELYPMTSKSTKNLQK
jgi:hypothetical protein